LIYLSLTSCTKVILLGTGDPTAINEGRAYQSFAIVLPNNATYLVDLGIGVMGQAIKAGININLLNTVFVTHLHSDHTLGLGDLINVPHRMNPVTVYGPPGISHMVNATNSALKQDHYIRINGSFPMPPVTFITETVEIKDPGLAFQDENIRVFAIKVQHGDWKYAYGFRFETSDGKVIVYSGDTIPVDTILDASTGCDLLLHEVYSLTLIQQLPIPGAVQYAKVSHTSTQELSTLAMKAGVKKLGLIHTGAGSETQIMQDMASMYTGDYFYAHDLDVIQL